MKKLALPSYKTITAKTVDERPMIGSINPGAMKRSFIKSVIQNAPALLTLVPGVGTVASTVTQTAIDAAINYYEDNADQKRQKEINSFQQKTEQRLKTIEIREAAKDYWENSIIFHWEEIMRKLISEPGKGFDDLLAEFVANSLHDLSSPPTAKDLILASLLAIDSVDIQVLIQIDIQFRHLLDNGDTRGASFADLVTLLRPSKIDEIMISRSIQRLQSQDLIHPLNTNSASIQELLAQRELLEGVKSPQFYSQGGFVISAFGRRFLRFLKLSI